MDAEAREIAQHLARVSLYELDGIEALYPDVKEKAERLIKKMKELGMDIRIVEGFRSAKKQNYYYSKGRTSSGNVITNSEGLESYHQYCLAFDVCFRRYGYNPPDHWWDRLGEEGKKLGLQWGGDWENFPDRPHFQWICGFTWREIKDYFKQ